METPGPNSAAKMADNLLGNSGDVSLHLFTYYRSSCSARLRIALALKKLYYESTYINLLDKSQHGDNYTAINPSHTVPTLEVKHRNHSFRITQSVAALEYLDEGFPETYQLMPPSTSPEARSIVRVLVNIIASDTQPPTNLRILERVRKAAENAGQDPVHAAKEWAQALMTEGLLSYETICKSVAGRYSVGDKITMADCCLAPAVWGAERFGVDLTQMPTVRRIYDELNQQQEVRKSHWRNQIDTPAELA